MLRARFRATVLCAVLAFAAAGSGGPAPERVQEEILADYVAAVQDGDAARIEALCPPGVDAAGDAAAKVRDVGGRRWSDVRISWDRGEFAGLARATVTAVDARGRPVRDTVDLTAVDGEWFLGLGSDPDAPEPASTVGGRPS